MQGSNPILPSLYTCIYKFYKFGHRMPVPSRFAGCHRTSDAGFGRFTGCHRTSVAGSGPVRQMPPDVGCRPPAATGTDHCRMPDRRLPPVPITVGCRATGHHRYRSPSDAGHRSDSASPVRCRMLCATGPVLVCQNLYMWLGNLHF